jgi:hypothetical protein
VKAVANEMEEEQNKMSWCVIDKDRKQISSMNNGVGQVDSMEDVAMTCMNICGMQLAIIYVLTSKPLLYRFFW